MTEAKSDGRELVKLSNAMLVLASFFVLSGFVLFLLMGVLPFAGHMASLCGGVSVLCVTSALVSRYGWVPN
jgi:CHASE2 domain-containing sensor protein